MNALSRPATLLRALFLLAALLSLTALCPAAYPPDGTIPNGFGVQLKGYDNSAENLDLIKNLGLKWLRHGFHWEGIEKEKGVYDFAKMDVFMNDAKARGFTVIGVLAFSNKIYGSHAKDEPGRTGFANYAAALAAHYKDYDIVWEIWNEPNTMTFWGRHGKVGNSEPYAEEYLGLVKATVPAMKKANPKCIILGGAVSGLWTESFKWMDFCFKKGILKTGIDVWSVHPYSLKSPEDYVEAYAKMREMMVAAGGAANFPVIDSERGFPLGKAEGSAGGSANMAREYQAWHVVRQYLIDSLCGIKATLWYEWMGSEKEGFSLYQPGPPQPVFLACQALIVQLRGYKFDRRIDLGAPRDFALRFTNAAGAIKVVTWTGPPPNQTADKAIPHAVKIPVPANGPLNLVDLYGKPSTATAQGGTLDLTISGAPQYIVVKK